MALEKSKPLSIYRAMGFLALGVISGIQIALYMYDYYDDGVADVKSLLIGIVILIASVSFVLYSFRRDS
jgi:hypothetical protein